jgi:hypothetical protein
MKMEELRKRLHEEHFAEHAYRVGEGWSSAADAFCLAEEGSAFEIFYVERGQKGASFGRYTEEQAACEAFYELLCSNS